MTGSLPASTRPAFSPGIIQASLIPLAQQPPPTHTSPCNPEPSALRPARAFRGSGRPSSLHAGEPSANRGPSSSPGPQKPAPSPSAHPARPTLRWRRPERSPRDAWSWEAGGRKWGGRVSKKVSPNLGRGLHSSPLQGLQGGRRSAKHPEHGETLPAPRDSPPDREGAVRARGSDCEAGPQREGRSAGGARPRFPGKRPRL